MTSEETLSAESNTAHSKVNHEASNLVTVAMQSIEQILFDAVDSDIEVLRKASRHILQAGGKRIRPRLLMLSFAAVGGTDISLALPPAAAIELVHTASVVHDDINDHGVVRRGRPSVNAVWGRTFALLTGDFLFTKVYELMAPYKDLNELFAGAAIALVEGETLQAAAIKDNSLSSEIYYKIIALKTAELFRVGAMLGAKLASASSDEIKALEQYGYNIGLAFQIIDDVLDIIGDEGQLGKTAGLDAKQGKGFASIHDNGGNADDPMEAIKRKIMDGDTINEAQRQAQNLVEQAIDALNTLKDTPYKEGLIDLANAIVNRQS
jgi:octaprenyl-diphosphate synthase